MLYICCFEIKYTLSHTLFKIVTVFRPSALLKIFFMGDQDRALPTHTQNFELHPSVGCHSPLKDWGLPLPIPPLIENHILEKRISNSFFNKNFACGAHFQFHNHDLFEKVFIGIKSINTKQRSAESPPWIITRVSPILPPFILLVAPNMYWLSCPFPRTYHLGETQ